VFRQGVLLDITDCKEAEEQVLFQAHLIEQVQAAVIATDLRGRVTHWNEYAERLYGWSREETLGRDVRDLTVGPETRPRTPRR
jgi:PAS domain S-box-containing protein